jgi:G3E family GTPase
MIPFYLVTGFLGSGKTTFLKNVLATWSGEQRIAVIQNEFAAQGVDGAELKLAGSGFKLVEINNGSVFCVCLMATFVESLQKVIREYNPEMIFLEASGLADPINIIELLGREGLKENVGLAHIITIVDAPNFERGMKMLPRFRHQVMIADTVIVNKSDIFKGSRSLLSDEISKLNPFAGIIETAWCKTDLKDLIFPEDNNPESTGSGSENMGGITSGRITFYEASQRDIPGEGNFITGTRHRAAASLTGTEPGGRPEINACVLRAHGKLTPEGLMLFIKELQESSPRIKGFINLTNGNVMAVQTVFEYCDVRQVSGYEGPSEIIAFGNNLTVRHLMNSFKKHSGRRIQDESV